MFYISTESIKESYRRLTAINFTNQSILHIFLILKGIGINSLSYSSLNDIKNHALPYAQELGYLFSPLEEAPDKNDFINPFFMKEWASNPTEKLAKWVNGRIKNNVIGGATTWRSFIMQDTSEDFKFTYNYVEEIAKLTIGNSKIPLAAISVWANRFTQFEEKISISELVSFFCKRFNITEKEIDLLFETNTPISLSFSNKLHSTQDIRSLIGNPNTMPNWVGTKPIINNTMNIGDEMNVIRRYHSMDSHTVKTDTLNFVLSNYHQLILSGPPATSKSYLLSELSKNYSKVVHIQFHPQYSYQQFIGGYFVEGSNVVFKNGILYELAEEAKANTNKKYLLIIDEINRANTGQVFGETIQALDRNESVQIIMDGQLVQFAIPRNLHIVGTMNTTDRSVGYLDYALKRRFLNIYCQSNPKLLIELTKVTDSNISLCDFLEKINLNLQTTVKNKEYVIGHGVFFETALKNKENVFEWNTQLLEMLFNYKILPLIEDFCGNEPEYISGIVGEQLSKRLTGEDFKKALEDFAN